MTATAAPRGAPTVSPLGSLGATVQPRPMVEATGVSKWFGDVVAVSDVSFELGAGVTALLGPNGAGKSTMLRMLSGLIPPDRGELRLLGRDPRVDIGILRRIGLVPQQETVFDAQTALEFVEMAGVLHGIPRPDRAARQALSLVELDHRDTRRLSTYSRGMRQRVKVAQAIVHSPRVIVLDEPLTGLDPRQRRHMTRLFHELGDLGCCVVVSSHVLDEVERFGSNVLVIAQGRLAAEGDFRAIRDLMEDRPHRIRLSTDQPHQLAGHLLADGRIMGLEVVDAQSVVIETNDVHAFRRSVAVIAKEIDARLWGVVPLDDDLDSVFRYLVGR